MSLLAGQLSMLITEVAKHSSCNLNCVFENRSRCPKHREMNKQLLNLPCYVLWEGNIHTDFLNSVCHREGPAPVRLHGRGHSVHPSLHHSFLHFSGCAATRRTKFQNRKWRLRKSRESNWVSVFSKSVKHWHTNGNNLITANSHSLFSINQKKHLRFTLEYGISIIELLTSCW